MAEPPRGVESAMSAAEGSTNDTAAAAGQGPLAATICTEALPATQTRVLSASVSSGSPDGKPGTANLNLSPPPQEPALRKASPPPVLSTQSTSSESTASAGRWAGKRA